MNEFEKDNVFTASEEETVAAEEKTEERPESEFVYETEEPEYNANIPGPTKYDHAHRTYADALERDKHNIETPERHGPAIASLILGIVSMIFSIIPILGFVLGIGSSVAGIVLGAYGIKGKKRTMSIVGLVLSVIALVLIFIITALFVVFIFVSLSEGFSSYGTYRTVPPQTYFNPFSYYFAY